MTWRNLKREDIKVGLAVKLTRMQDCVYNGATIMRIDGDYVTLARPMAYAHNGSKSPLLYSEVFEISIPALTDWEVQVWESEKLGLLTHDHSFA